MPLRPARRGAKPRSRARCRFAELPPRVSAAITKNDRFGSQASFLGCPATGAVYLRLRKDCGSARTDVGGQKRKINTESLKGLILRLVDARSAGLLATTTPPAQPRRPPPKER